MAIRETAKKWTQPIYHGKEALDHFAMLYQARMPYVNVCGTFYCLVSVRDGSSRLLVHWELRERMRETDVEVVRPRARERFPDARPGIITDNGPQFIAKDFKEFIRFCGMTHVRTSPYHPQSNGKIERWHQTLKVDCIRPHMPLSLDDARQLVESFVDHYNRIRLHSAIGYVTLADKLTGREAAIFTDRDRKLAAARERRAQKRQLAADVNGFPPSTPNTERRVEGAWERGDSSSPISETSAAQPLHSINTHGTTKQPLTAF